MRASRALSSGMSSWIAPQRILLALCLLLFSGSAVEATITVVGTQQQFPSEPVNGIGRHLWKGSEYIGRLQYLPHYMDLCNLKEPLSVTVPKDGVPVALLASTGNCSKEDQARIASTMIKPENVVSYLIVEDTSRKTTILGHEDDNKDYGALDDENAEVSEEDEDLLFNLLKQGIMQDDSIKVAVLKISQKTYNQLLTITAMESTTDRENGGAKITLNSKVPNATAKTFLAWATISMAFCCCACFCVSLAYQHGVFTVETEPEAPPPRPVRRRLTVAQVREKFPSYRFYPGMDGPIEEEGENDEEDGLETSSEMMGECSICLDDFLAGQRVRQLPCGHVFHSTCIARWLVERNAVCPLCKLDVFEEEEEESSSSSEEEEREADPLVSDTPTSDEELANQGVASNSRWWPFSSTSSGSVAPGTRWAMRWLSQQRRRGNGDGDTMLTEMTNPLLAADRSEDVEAIEFQSPTNARNAESSDNAQEEDPESPSQSEGESPSESSSNEEQGSEESASTPVEV